MKFKSRLALLPSALIACFYDYSGSNSGVVDNFDDFTDVNVQEVTKLINSLPCKSSSVDFIHTALIKSSVTIFAPLITKLANLSFLQGIFPAELKSAKITPLLKK